MVARVVIGVDVHKRSHTFVAVDQSGRKLGQVTVKAVAAGHDKAIRWAHGEYGAEGLLWAIEDCRAFSARLEVDLLDAGQAVVRVPPKMTADVRRAARGRGKSDPIDALAVAHAVLREPDLPVAAHDEASRELKLLVDHRDNLVKQRTATVNRFRSHLHRIDPGLDPEPKALNRARRRGELGRFLSEQTGIDARLARELLADIEALSVRIDDLEREITTLVRSLAPALLELPGCGPLSAAKIYGECAGIGRFATEAKFAMHAGTAPIPVWSGNTHGRVRLNRAGNRQLNAALHRIALAQIRRDGAGRSYYDKRLAAGDSTSEALRCLKRRLARVVFNTLKRSTAPASTPPLLDAA